MINENEIYSCGQLDFYNALSHSDKLKLQTATANSTTAAGAAAAQQINAIDEPAKSTAAVKLEKIKLEIDTLATTPALRVVAAAAATPQIQQSQNIINDALPADIELPELLFKRVAAQKANPKTVTASVFKAIPVGGANTLLKPINSGKTLGIGSAIDLPIGSATATATIARAPQSVTASLIQPIASFKRDLFGKSQAFDRTNIVVEPSVVTASLFQPRTNAIGGGATATATGITSKLFSTNNNAAATANGTDIVDAIADTINANTAANQLASRTEAMNKPFLMFTDDIRQLTSEYFSSISACNFDSETATTKK